MRRATLIECLTSLILSGALLAAAPVAAAPPGTVAKPATAGPTAPRSPLDPPPLSELDPVTDEEPQATLEAEPEPMPASGLEPIPISELDPVTDEELQAMSAPAPAPASAEGPVEDPMLDLPQPLTPEERARAQRYRRAGVITMGFGGAITALGAVFAIGHTLRGKGLREEWRFAEERFTAANCSRFPQKERCPILGAIVTGLDRKAEQAQRGSQRGGIAILSGIAVIAVGGVIYRIGVKRLQARELALSPSLGGAVLHGRF